MFSLATLVASLLAVTLARPQYGRSSAQSHTIVVGGPNGELTFTPEAIAASVGDTVIFEFHQKNHSATQSSFASPCGHVDGGFDAGFNPVAANVTSGFPTFTYTVADTKPVWVFCAQAGGAHCAAGMVFAINCGADGSANSFTNFKAAAMATAATSSSAYGYGSAPATTSAGEAAALPDTTSYPGVTIPPPEVAETVTSTVVVGSSTWTTTYASYPNSPDPTPSSLEGSVIKVTVGANGLLRYDPPTVVAKPRDTIMFEFHAKNHTATQSSFADPCRKLSLTSNPPQDSFDSGFFPTAADATTFSTWNLTINDTAPIWVYCRQTGHCGMGMVLAINSDEAANSTHTFAAFQTLAMEINGTTTSNTSTPGTTGLPGAPSGSSKVTASLVFGAVSALVGVFLL
jgi:plastocyanin